ncbi:hypothetical protein G3I53_04865, partial [Streptomyces sp. SID14436]|nr:hypothetical protein [Streptomyces sp. SID14436]
PRPTAGPSRTVPAPPPEPDPGRTRTPAPPPPAQQPAPPRPPEQNTGLCLPLLNLCLGGLGLDGAAKD